MHYNAWRGISSECDQDVCNSMSEAWIHRAVESMGLNAQVHKEVVAVANLKSFVPCNT